MEWWRSSVFVWLVLLALADGSCAFQGGDPRWRGGLSRANVMLPHHSLKASRRRSIMSVDRNGTSEGSPEDLVKIANRVATARPWSDQPSKRLVRKHTARTRTRAHRTQAHKARVAIHAHATQYMHKHAHTRTYRMHSRTWTRTHPPTHPHPPTTTHTHPRPPTPTHPPTHPHPTTRTLQIFGLAFNAGWADVVLLEKYSCFPTMMTGNSIKMTSALCAARWVDVAFYATVIAAYVSGTK